jgi:hypothetical protein
MVWIGIIFLFGGIVVNSVFDNRALTILTAVILSGLWNGGFWLLNEEEGK